MVENEVDLSKIVIYQEGVNWHFRPANFLIESRIPFSHDYATKAAAVEGAKGWLRRNQS